MVCVFTPCVCDYLSVHGSCFLMSHDLIFSNIVSYHLMSHFVKSNVVSCSPISHVVLSCHIFSCCLILFYLMMSYIVSCCPMFDIVPCAKFSYCTLFYFGSCYLVILYSLIFLTYMIRTLFLFCIFLVCLKYLCATGVYKMTLGSDSLCVCIYVCI